MVLLGNLGLLYELLNTCLEEAEHARGRFDLVRYMLQLTETLPEHFRWRADAERALFARIRSALDPSATLNPNVLPAYQAAARGMTAREPQLQLASGGASLGRGAVLWQTAAS